MNSLPYNGCSYHDDCLTCPLPKCRYDMAPKQAEAMYTMYRVVQLHENGVPVHEIMAQLGVSRRTVFRHLSRNKRGIYS